MEPKKIAKEAIEIKKKKFSKGTMVALIIATFAFFPIGLGIGIWNRDKEERRGQALFLFWFSVFMSLLCFFYSVIKK